ncbi:MAG TPA: hypothetical protein V6C81_17650 [Planktothrix sp.]|jgi:hypothetical protein
MHKIVGSEPGLSSESVLGRRQNRIGIALLVVLSVQSFFLPASFADPSDLSETEDRASRAQLSLNNVLTAESRQLASALGLMAMLERLRTLSEHKQHKQGQPSTPETMAIRQEITETVLTTMLQCQEVTTEIDAEISDAHDAMALMGDKRDKALRLNSIANVTTNGLISTAGTILQMPEELSEQEGEILESGATALSGVLGVLALRQQNAEKLSSGVRPNMLARVFRRPNDSLSEYPDPVWRYLDTPLPASRDDKTRRELLIQAWEKLGRIQPHNTPKGRQQMRVLAGTVSLKNQVTMDVLDDRAAMLDDLRSAVGQMYKDLLNLMLTVRAL